MKAKTTPLIAAMLVALATASTASVAVAQAPAAPAAAPAAAADPAAEAAAKQRASAAIDRLEAQQFDALASDFNAEMKAQVDVAQLRDGWNGLSQQAGALQARGEPLFLQQDGYDIVVTPLQFENGMLNAIVSFDAEGAIAGLMLQPAQPPAGPDGQPATPQPAPAQPSS